MDVNYRHEMKTHISAKTPNTEQNKHITNDTFFVDFLFG